MITGINELKTLTNHIPCNVNINLMVKFVIQIKSGITTNVGVNVKIQKISYMSKDYICNPATCSGENDKYLCTNYY